MKHNTTLYQIDDLSALVLSPDNVDSPFTRDAVFLMPYDASENGFPDIRLAVYHSTIIGKLRGNKQGIISKGYGMLGVPVKDIPYEEDTLLEQMAGFELLFRLTEGEPTSIIGVVPQFDMSQEEVLAKLYCSFAIRFYLENEDLAQEAESHVEDQLAERYKMNSFSGFIRRIFNKTSRGYFLLGETLQDTFKDLLTGNRYESITMPIDFHTELSADK